MAENMLSSGQRVALCRNYGSLLLNLEDRLTINKVPEMAARAETPASPIKKYRQTKPWKIFALAASMFLSSLFAGATPAGTYSNILEMQFKSAKKHESVIEKKYLKEYSEEDQNLLLSHASKKLEPAQSAEDYRLLVRAPAEFKAYLLKLDREIGKYYEVRDQDITLGNSWKQTPFKKCRIFKKVENVTRREISFSRKGAAELDSSEVRLMYIGREVKKVDGKERVTRWIGIHNFPKRYGRDKKTGELYEIPYNLKLGQFVSGGCIRMQTEDMNEMFDAVANGTEIIFDYNTVEVNKDYVMIHPDTYKKFKNKDPKKHIYNELIRDGIDAGRIPEEKLNRLANLVNVANESESFMFVPMKNIYEPERI